MNRTQKVVNQIPVFLRSTNFNGTLEKSPQSIWAVLLHVSRVTLQQNSDSTDYAQFNQKNVKGARFFRGLSLVKQSLRLMGCEFTIMQLLKDKQKTERVVQKMIRFSKYSQKTNQALAPIVRSLQDKQLAKANIQTKLAQEEKALHNFRDQKLHEKLAFQNTMNQIKQLQLNCEQIRASLLGLETKRTQQGSETAQLERLNVKLSLQGRSLDEQIKMLQGQLVENTSEMMNQLKSKEEEYRVRSHSITLQAQKEEQQFKHNNQVLSVILKEISQCLYVSEQNRARLNAARLDKRTHSSMLEQASKKRLQLSNLKKKLEELRLTVDLANKDKAEQSHRLRVALEDLEAEKRRMSNQLAALTQKQRVVQKNLQESGVYMQKGFSELVKQVQSLKKIKQQKQQQAKSQMGRLSDFQARVKQMVHLAFS